MMIASLLSTSGCALAIAPAVGIGTGAVIGLARHHNDPYATVAGPAIVGVLAGVAVDAFFVFLALRSLERSYQGSDPSDRRAP
jgi:hypothetical protein